MTAQTATPLDDGTNTSPAFYCLVTIIFFVDGGSNMRKQQQQYQAKMGEVSVFY